jgi:hypothetical protein
VCLTGIEPVSITRERPPTGEETDWRIGHRKLCPGLCPNACLPSINTVTPMRAVAVKSPAVSEIDMRTSIVAAEAGPPAKSRARAGGCQLFRSNKSAHVRE